MNIYIVIFAGGGFGAVLRFLVSSLVSRHHPGSAFPWGTLAVNLTGAFLIGLIIELGALKLNLSQTSRAFLVTGILGGFTTFSAFSLETTLLLSKGAYAPAASYIALSVIATVALVFAAMLLMRQIV
ncbi:MAG TPA: fluoride efflux transporter CrcB [Alphaproteobacteria bacterium]